MFEISITYYRVKHLVHETTKLERHELTIILTESEYNGTVGRGEIAANVTRALSTNGVFDIILFIVGFSPANIGSIPVHSSALVDEQGIGDSAIGDQNSLEVAGRGLCGV